MRTGFRDGNSSHSTHIHHRKISFPIFVSVIDAIFSHTAVIFRKLTVEIQGPIRKRRRLFFVFEVRALSLNPIGEENVVEIEL